MFAINTIARSAGPAGNDFIVRPRALGTSAGRLLKRGERRKCYCCNQPAVGGAPRSRHTGGPWTGGRAVIVPACAQHVWAEPLLRNAAAGRRTFGAGGEIFAPPPETCAESVLVAMNLAQQPAQVA